jgi:hypothetical protein
MGGQHARARRAYEVLARRANSHALARALDRVGPDEEEGASLELGELGILWIAWMADGIRAGKADEVRLKLVGACGGAGDNGLTPNLAEHWSRSGSQCQREDDDGSKQTASLGPTALDDEHGC